MNLSDKRIGSHKRMVYHMFKLFILKEGHVFQIKCIACFKWFLTFCKEMACIIPTKHNLWHITSRNMFQKYLAM
jgi:hypothetical protein